MDKETLTFGVIEIEEDKVYGYETPILEIDLDIENILISQKVSFVAKIYRYFIGYLYDDYKVKPLQTMLPKTSAYVKNYDEQLHGCII